MAKRYLVTSALPYVNNIPHLGNLVGSVLPADVFTRYLRIKGEEVIYVCGTDEHGTPITVSAKKENMSPKDLTDKYYKIISENYAKFDIQFDNFSRTTRDHHYDLSQHFFSRLNENGFILKQTMQMFYCSTCETYLPDRYVEGTCPKCQASHARGDQCDACGNVLDPTELIEPACITCHGHPEIRDTIHWFLDLPKLAPDLKNWLEKNTHWPSNARNFPLGWIEEGLKPRAITRDLSWGVPVPLEEAKDKVIYVWFDAPIGYISATREWAKEKGDVESWKQYWLDEDCHIVHFLGKDNVPFHTIIWPAMLIGVKENYNLPWYVASYEYLNFEGKKFSKSKGHGVWINNALELYPVDYWRYALMAMSPQSRDSDFTWEEFSRKINDELADIIGNFVHRTLTFINKFFNGTIPTPSNLTSRDQEMLDALKQYPVTVGQKFDKYDLKGALYEILLVAKEGNKYFNEKAPWKAMKENPEDGGNTMYVCTEYVKSLALLLSPYIPRSSEKMWNFCGFESKLNEHNWLDVGRTLIQPGQKINNPEVLFSKIDMAELKEKAAKPEKEKEKIKEKPKKEASSMIDFNDFTKVKMKVAQIEKAEPVEGAKKLFKLVINLGDEKRQIVAGLAGHYAPDALVGKKIVVVTNLKPAKIRGVDSNGMLLAAEAGEQVTLLTVDQDIEVGAEIC